MYEAFANHAFLLKSSEAWMSLVTDYLCLYRTYDLFCIGLKSHHDILFQSVFIRGLVLGNFRAKPSLRIVERQNKLLPF